VTRHDEDDFWIPRLFNTPWSKKLDGVGDLFGKTHFVSHDDHGHAMRARSFMDVDEPSPTIPGRAPTSARRTTSIFGSIARPCDRDALLLPPESCAGYSFFAFESDAFEQLSANFFALFLLTSFTLIGATVMFSRTFQVLEEIEIAGTPFRSGSVRDRSFDRSVRMSFSLRSSYPTVRRRQATRRVMLF